MSGPFGAGALQFFSGGGDFYPHSINQSLRFEDGDSAYLARTPSSASNRTTWTWSAWIKRGNLSYSSANMFGAYSGANDFEYIRFDSDDCIRYTYYISGSVQNLLKTSGSFRDTSAWYHILVQRSGSSSEIYVNGVQQDLQTETRASTNGYFNHTVAHNIGRFGGTGQHFDGYMAEMHFVDGTSLNPTSFGETKAGIWVPKNYTGSHGTNGFYLPFDDSSAIGDDESANTNDFSNTNLASTDVVLDSPTNNFATMNPLVPATDFTFAEGNLKATVGSTAWDTAASTYFLNSGKWYAEFHILDTNRVAVGAVSNLYDPTTFVGNNAEGIGYYDQGYTYASGANVTTGLTTFTNGDLIQVALNLDDSQISFYKANTLIKTENLPSSTGEDFGIAVTGYGSGSGAIVNFGQDSSFAGNETAQGNTDANGKGDFYYSPPSGFLALCSANLPDPAIDPAQDEESADYFNTVLYTGNGSTQSITGVGHQPDFVWTKQRNASANHRLFDSVRGAGKNLISNLTSGEGTDANTLTSFDSDGFSLGNSTQVNDSGDTYVAWNWLAGGSASSNTDGTITSSVSANTKAGFSIVGWTSPGGGSNTIGHGLNSAPEFIITKTRTASIAYNWNSYHIGTDSSAPEDYAMALNTTAARASSSTAWDSTAPTSSVFSVNSTATVGASGDAMIAYCFHSVDGYSKVGSYTGNGSSDGPFVYTGFRPAFLLMKRTNATSNWYTWDAKRDVDNGIRLYIRPNLSNAEGGTSSGQQYFDFVSNGFKIVANSSAFGDGNTSGATHIYLAFAEQPFKYSNAR